MSHSEFFGKTSNHRSDSAPLQPRFGALWLLAFPKSKITLEREEISQCWWDSGKYNGAGWQFHKGFCRVFWTEEDVLGNCVRSQGAYFEGDWGVIVLQTVFLVSSSINVSIFHSTWMDTFWTFKTEFACLESTHMLSFLEETTKVFKWCTHLYSYQQCINAPVSPHFFPYWYGWVFFIQF